MAITTIIKEIKQIHPNEIILVRIGEFFHVYGKDSYIIAYLFNYKIQTIDGNICMSGFPAKCLPKIIANLENKRINYLIVDRRNNYNVEEFSNNKGLNTYQEIFEKAHEYINLKVRVDKIYSYLSGNMLKQETKKKIKEIEQIIST